jgi:putative peptide zinc metalloprotease protein
MDRIMIQQDDIILQPLRGDITLQEGPVDEAGTPTWLIHDPLQHRYFQIDENTVRLLSIWKGGLSFSQLAQLASDQYNLAIDQQQIIQLLVFLRSSNLTLEEQAGSWRDVSERANAGKQSLFWQAVHKYLFFKVPLFHPQRALEAALPYVEPFYSKTFGVLLGICGATGIYLVSRQWDQFLGTFNSLFSLEGLLYFLLSLLLLKSLHELGHAFTAVRLGCRVSSIGVAFMMMTPLLYTDVSDAWRLSSRKQRILISAAGMLVELALALIATFLWVFLPEGAARSIAFMIATTGWIMSLGFNLNPCMKFDGYYLLSDFLSIDNLQSRAFALGRWKLRCVLLAPTLAPPEKLSPRMQKGLILYAWATWVYRLVLFTTIAVFLYTFTFKILGIFLFALEMWLLVIRPVSGEIMHWRDIDSEQFSLRRIAILSSLIIGFLTLFVVPWSTRIEIPAVLLAADLTHIYPTRAAQIISVSAERGTAINEGSPILQLRVPEIDSQIAGVEVKRNLARLHLAQIMADGQKLDQLLILRQELGSQQTRLDGLIKETQELVIRAPMNGTILQMASDLHQGRWIGKNNLLAIVASGKEHIIKGYISGADLLRLTDEARGQFIPEDLSRPAFPVKLVRTDDAGSRTIDILELTSNHGGKIAVEVDRHKKLVPLSAQYLIELQPVHLDYLPKQVVRGMVHLRGIPQSLLKRAWYHVSKVLVRESGF